MNVALSKPWSIERFLDWAGARDERYEFDGTAPVAMTGVTIRHGRVMSDVHAALRSRLRGTGCSYHGPDVGLRTVGDAVRFPDALVTCEPCPEMDRLAPGAVIVFEVVSPTSERMDRVTKRREYAAVPSIRSYVIIETSSQRVTVLHRNAAEQDWVESDVDVVDLPEIGVSIPIPELYEDVAFNS